MKEEPAVEEEQENNMTDEITKESSTEVSTDSSIELNENQSLKRKREEGEFIQRPKKVKGPPLPKNPAMILHELSPGSVYTLVSSTGMPPHTQFVMEVEYEGQKYQGIGQSKQLAKHNAAAMALRSAVQFKEPDKVVPYMIHPDRNSIDFTADTLVEPMRLSSMCMNVDPVVPKHKVGSPPSNHSPTPPNSTTVKKTSRSLKSPVPPDKNPVMLLNELCLGLQYECVEETGSYQSKVFTMQVTVNGNNYQGYGKNKKQGKVGAAIKALRNEFDITLTMPDQEMVPSNNSSDDAPIQICGNLPDQVYKAVRDKFASLTNNGESESARHKVLAGIVMTTSSGPEDGDCEVIALATGTKCVSGEYISNQGTVLFDCHAEIVSRRGFRKFLYEQLQAYARGELSVLEPGSNGGYRVKPNVSFHLYINTSPCGDSRIFSPSESSAEANDNHPNRMSRGLVRTKIENGEGTIPVESGSYVQERERGNVQQMWDAVISGERLLTMSCSDKVAKWNILGLQGSLLSVFLEPVYLSSIILGSLYHAKHLERGVFGRVKDAVETSCAATGLSGVPLPFRVHRPLLAAVPNPQKRVAKKAPTFCLHWTIGEAGPQVINTATGRTNDGESSSLCKLEMMKMFVEIASNSSLKPRLPLEDLSSLTYGEIKNKATDYQSTKYILMTGFHQIGCGSWVGKPSEVDMFTCR